MLVVLALAAVMVLTITLGLWHLRRDTLLLQTRSLASLASASADDLERGLQGVLLALQATRDDLREERLQPGHAETGAQLHRRVAVLTMVRKLWVVDTAGQVQAASTPAAMPAVASFRPPLDQLGGDAAALSEPFTDLASHETSAAVAMRFVRPGGGLRPARVFAVQPVVEQVLGLLAGSADARVEVARDIATPPLPLRGDAAALFEAVMNLCTNALQAMPAGGRLGVAVQAVDTAPGHWLSHGELAPGAYVCISVSDTGRGIAPEVMERLFEPFFTTRGQAGTGLGLAVVHGVAAEFGGQVDVSSTPGQGSRFTLWLPHALEAPAPEAAAAAEAVQGQGQCVMVLDDEPALVQWAEELLAGLGYEPVGFTDPAKALAALEKNPRRFDFLLTDEVMPGLPGTEVARRAQALRAGLPVLMLSGYGGPALVQRAREAGIGQVLAKPVQADELARALAAAL